MKRFLKALCGLILVLLLFGYLILSQIIWPRVDADMNAVVDHAPYDISDTAAALHAELWVADLHADSLLWRRNPAKRHDYGQVDLPRLAEGGVEFQVFSAVTKSPEGQNFDGNDANAPDRITTLAQAQLWPIRTWDSLYERAAYQAQRLQKLERAGQGKFIIARTAADLKAAIDNPEILIGILETEGAHPLEGDLANIARLKAEGYRAMGLQHFFDNALGGSMHGRSQAGLTEFGRAAVAEMRAQGIIIDVAHSSTQTVRDVLALTPDPIFISHGGTVVHCPRTANRNLPDDVLQAIAARGGIIGIGFFNGAICDISPNGIADAIIDAVALLGVDAVALGSDFDGTVTTSLDSSELAAITGALLRRGLTETDIRAVMGENARRFFTENLPAE
jgi:microsomal dipeptidase-like Zn-dependent dipeptidase